MPPCQCRIGLGSPVVPDEYSTHIGASKGTYSKASVASTVTRSGQRSASGNVAASSR